MNAYFAPVVRFPNVAVPNNRRLFLRKCSFNIAESTNSQSSIVDFLRKECGFSLDRAISISKCHRIRFKSIENSILVLKFLEKQGFNQTQITKIIHKRPTVLVLIPEHDLKPKFEYLNNLGFSDTKLVKLFYSDPDILVPSLDDTIIPSVNFLKSYISSSQDVLTTITYCPSLVGINLEKTLAPNIATLQRYLVPKSNISKFLVKHPRVLNLKSERFIRIVDQIKQMGFDPSSTKFIEAVHVFGGADKQTWVRRLMVYREFGFSEEEIVSLFRNQPRCMMLSEEKMRKGLNLLVKQLKWDPAYICKYAVVLLYSMEKRIIPRCTLLESLVLEGLLERNVFVGRTFKLSQMEFYEKFVMKYKDIVPQAVKTYQDMVRSVGSEGLARDD